ncbi:MAG: hypothetical protein V2A73_05960 [Pseudomonadota bacterium]
MTPSEQEQSRKTFYCPHCLEKLSCLGGTVVKLSGRLSAKEFAVKTNFYLPAELGRYGAIIEGQVEVGEGARVEFCCPNPRCGTSFTATYNSDLAEIQMVDHERREYVVVFNRICGRRSTFLVDYRRKALLCSYGEDAESYAAAFERPLNFFGS